MRFKLLVPPILTVSLIFAALPAFFTDGRSLPE